MTRILARLRPQSLVAQIIWLVAIGLFLAQAVNVALLWRERSRQGLIGTAAPAVARILDALDRGVARMPPLPLAEPEPASSRPPEPEVTFSTQAPRVVGTRRADVEERAAAMFREADLTPSAIIADERVVPNILPPHLERMANNRRIERSPTVRRLFLAVEYQPGRWANVNVRSSFRQPRVGGWLLGQTTILYFFTLLPLLFIGWRLARPLKDLTAAARRFADTGAADPVAERGPGDVRQLTTAFNAMRARLVAMLDEKDRMLGAIGHDLRTPLASLRLRAESIDDEGERARAAETIEEMRRILDDILSLARAGRGTEDAQRTDLTALADAVVEDFIELGAPVQLADCPRQIATVRPQMMRRALRNLIENAIKYAGGATVSVEPGEGGAILMVVRDTGPGIDPARMAEMMEPFTRLDNSRNRDTGGAGLGLALVRAIIQEQGGRLELANAAGGGLEARLVIAA